MNDSDLGWLDLAYATFDAGVRIGCFHGTARILRLQWSGRGRLVLWRWLLWGSCGSVVVGCGIWKLEFGIGEVFGEIDMVGFLCEVCYFREGRVERRSGGCSELVLVVGLWHLEGLDGTSCSEDLYRGRRRQGGIGVQSIYSPWKLDVSKMFQT